MKYIKLGKSNLTVSQVALGCMRMDALTDEEAASYLAACRELGIQFFEHADIYAGGVCEERFGNALAALGWKREDLVIQSKCGIVPGVMYDFSKEHIVRSVEQSLKRLRTDYLDVLVLHRPDALMEPEEVAAAFDALEQAGKVRYFGVSNHKPIQMQLLKKCVRQELVADQMQFSIACSNMVASGLEVNMTSDGAVNRDSDTLDFCRLHDITIQAWSPFQAPNGQGTFIDNENYPKLNEVLAELAKKYGASKTTIAAAWILRHPARIQLIAGTMNPARMEQIVQATEITLSREEWYRLYLAAGHILP
jgi:predicted oxidoreductase